MKLKQRRKIKKGLISFLKYFSILFLWGSLFFFIFFVSPNKWYIVAGFFVLLFLSVSITGLVVFKNLFLGSLISVFTASLLLLQLFRQLNWLNLFLLSAFCLAVYIHFYRLDKV